MAYLRYDRKCAWYVFWNASEVERKEDELLAIWHIEHRAKGPTFTYTQVRQMLKDNNFSAIPGFEKIDESLLMSALEEFVADVDEEYK